MKLCGAVKRMVIIMTVFAVLFAVTASAEDLSGWFTDGTTGWSLLLHHVGSQETTYVFASDEVAEAYADGTMFMPE